jgi:chlorite dismutase
MSNAAVETQTQERKPKVDIKRQIVSFVFFQVDPAWRRLSESEKQASKQEFEQVIESFVEKKRCQILTYTMMGMKADTDFMLWIISEDLDTQQDLASALAKTKLGAYLTRSYNFLAMTKRTMYIDRQNPEHAEDRLHIRPGKHKYFFVYPFVKKREWYLLSLEERQKMMDEHIRVGTTYPSVKLNTTYSFGLDDQEFVVAFETDTAADFLDLVQELRESQASNYTLRDTPIFTCISKTAKEMLDSIG